mmetsp:Transcript_54784/g.90861  ORF Transcript_54784/g.90861 Transcript_54784/m.90861 type:complete len:269 (-) Transcript_54784:223-1029(-)
MRHRILLILVLGAIVVLVAACIRRRHLLLETVLCVRSIIAIASCSKWCMHGVRHWKWRRRRRFNESMIVRRRASMRMRMSLLLMVEFSSLLVSSRAQLMHGIVFAFAQRLFTHIQIEHFGVFREIVFTAMPNTRQMHLQIVFDRVPKLAIVDGTIVRLLRRVCAHMIHKRRHAGQNLTAVRTFGVMLVRSNVRVQVVRLGVRFTAVCALHAQRSKTHVAVSVNRHSRSSIPVCFALQHTTVGGHWPHITGIAVATRCCLWRWWWMRRM